MSCKIVSSKKKQAQSLSIIRIFRMGKISLLLIATMFALVLALLLQVDTVEAVPKGGSRGGRGKFQTRAIMMLENISPSVINLSLNDS